MSYTVGRDDRSFAQPGADKPGEKLSLGVAARLSRYLQIRKIMRTSGQHNIALFGAGHLGTAIATSDIFADHGFRVVAVFDTDQSKVGEQIGPLHVRPNSEMRQVIEDEDIVVAVLAVPSAAAQGLADELADAGM